VGIIQNFFVLKRANEEKIMRDITKASNASGESFLRHKLYRIKYLPGLLLCVAGLSLMVAAAPSNLDPTFGVLGKVVSSPNGTPTFTSSGMAVRVPSRK
jgi:hypothetical protein